MITLAADETAPLGPTHYTITATSPTQLAMTDVALTVNPYFGHEPGQRRRYPRWR